MFPIHTPSPKPSPLAEGFSGLYEQAEDQKLPAVDVFNESLFMGGGGRGAEVWGQSIGMRLCHVDLVLAFMPIISAKQSA